MTLDPLEPRPRSVMEPVWSRRDGRERDRHRDRERETEGDRDGGDQGASLQGGLPVDPL